MPMLADQLEAIEAVVDEHGSVGEWAELLGLDSSAVRAQVLREAGLGDVEHSHRH